MKLLSVVLLLSLFPAIARAAPMIGDRSRLRLSSNGAAVTRYDSAITNIDLSEKDPSKQSVHMSIQQMGYPAQIKKGTMADLLKVEAALTDCKAPYDSYPSGVKSEVLVNGVGTFKEACRYQFQQVDGTVSDVYMSKYVPFYVVKGTFTKGNVQQTMELEVFIKN